MACDLETIFGALADRLPQHDDAKAEDAPDWITVFNAENLPRPRAELCSDNLSMRRSSWDYGSTPFEGVNLCASKRALRLLGLLILAKVFHDEPTHVTLQLGMPAVETDEAVRQLVLNYYCDTSERLGYITKPDLFRYMPNEVDKHPWHGSALQPLDMPILYLTGPDWEMGRMGASEKLETSVGFGTDYGHVNFAELLLNASMPWSERDEYALEGECGFRGVGPGSAEIRIFMPGHVFYDDPIPWPSNGNKTPVR